MKQFVPINIATTPIPVANYCVPVLEGKGASKTGGTGLVNIISLGDGYGNRATQMIAI